MQNELPTFRILFPTARVETDAITPKVAHLPNLEI